MPRVKKHTARQNIYRYGIRVPSEKTKSGFRRDRSQPDPSGDDLLVEKGRTYYTWSFRRGGQQFSYTYPTRQQLTQSEYYRACYDIEDEQGQIIDSSYDDLEDITMDLDILKDRVQELLDETQEKFDNMSYYFEGGSSYETLEQRIQDLDDFFNELDSISEPEIEEPDEADFEEWDDDEEQDVLDEDAFEEAKSDAKDQAIQEYLDEIENCSLEIS